MSCGKDHTGDIPEKAIRDLQDSQAGFWRHRCAGCAYEMGKRDAGEAAERLRARVRELTDEVARLKRELDVAKKVAS